MIAAARIDAAGADHADDAERTHSCHLLPPEGVRVLVVDDDASVRTAVRRLLTRRGFEVTTAVDVPPALASIRVNQPDLVLVDLGMPTPGLELVRQLKADYGDSIYVAILSGWIGDDTQDQCIDSGADEYLAKSISPSDLQRHLVVAARKQRAFVESRRERERVERERAYGIEAASMLAHDLNNNLMASLLNLEYLAKVAALDDEPREVLATTRYALERMAALVGNFVDIARFEDDRLVPAIADVSVRGLIEAILPTHRHPMGAQLDVECDPALSGSLDRALIERVLHNLVANAVRYSARAGRIVVRAAAWPATDHTGGVEITVHNLGPQVPAEAAARLFSKYGRGKDGARGVGLYFCRLVCDAHHGSIELMADDDGPTFRIRLPGRAIG